MKLKLILASVLVLAFALYFVNLSLSEYVYNISDYVNKLLNVTFDMDTKFEVAPGQELTVDGKMINSGYLWLYDVNLTAENVPEGFEVKLNPIHFDVFPRLFIFTNSIIGTPKPLNFAMSIKAPETPTELTYEFNLNVKGVFRRYMPGVNQFSVLGSLDKSQRIVLKILPSKLFTITDVSMPENVTVDKPFEVSMILTNNGNVAETANVSVSLPSDWGVDEAVKSISLGAQKSSTITFEITPTNTSGDVSVILTYPVDNTVVNTTEATQFFEPISPVEKPPVEVTLPKQIDITILTFIIIVVVVLIILGYTFSKYRIKIKREPEEIKENKKKTHMTETENKTEENMPEVKDNVPEVKDNVSGSL